MGGAPCAWAGWPCRDCAARRLLIAGGDLAGEEVGDVAGDVDGVWRVFGVGWALCSLTPADLDAVMQLCRDRRPAVSLYAADR